MKDKYSKMNMHVSNYDVNNYRVKILMGKLLNVVVVGHYDKGKIFFLRMELNSPTSYRIKLFLEFFFEMLK